MNVLLNLTLSTKKPMLINFKSCIWTPKMLELIFHRENPWKVF